MDLLDFRLALALFARECHAVRRLIVVYVMIPTEVGHGFRFEAGHCSGMKPASIPE